MWDKLKLTNELLTVQKFILSQVEKKWAVQNKIGILSPRQKAVNQSILSLIVNKKVPTLILCSDEAHMEEWKSHFEELFGLGDNSEFISELRLEYKATPILLATYSKFCHTLNASNAQRKVAREYWEYELASVGSWDQEKDNIGDYDAIKETEAMLNEEAIRQLSRYGEKLLRFIELGDDEKLIDTQWRSKHLNVFIEKLQQNNTGLIVCDNSNEVTGIWAELLYYVMNNFGSSKIINLSPLKVNLSELSPKNFHIQTSLFDSNPIEVKLPLLVQDNCFKPYLGLMAFTHPTAEEQELLNNASSYMKEVLEQVEDESQVSTTLTQFVVKELNFLEKDVPGNWGKRQEYVISVLNFIVSRSLPLSPVWNVFLDKMGDLQFKNQLPVFRDYIFRVLLHSDKKSERRLGEALIMAFRPLGFELNESNIDQRTSLIPNILNRSANKEELLIKYLSEEFINLERNIKAVIVSDFIDNSSASELFPGNEFDDSSCGMMSILEKLEKNPITLQLNPIVVYGNTIYFNPKFTKILMKEIETLSAEQDGLEVFQEEVSGYCYITVSGVINFQSFWSPLFKGLLSKRITHCFIVGREYLSAKWDGISFNTFFNMSSATSELFGIRLLARILMMDEEPVPAKHLWDFCAVMPEIEFGMADYERLAMRKEHGWHLCEDGEFERGISYFHPELKMNTKQISDKLINEINDTAMRLINTRQHTNEMWMAKHDRDKFVKEVLEITMHPDLDPFKKFHTQKLKRKKSVNSSFNSRDFIEILCNCIIKSVCEIDDIEDKPKFVLTVRRPGVFRAEISECSKASRDLIFETINMLFSPVNQQHYVVVVNCTPEGEGNILSRLFTDGGSSFKIPFGVPVRYTKKQELATFLNNWQTIVCNEKMMGHRLPEVRTQVKEMLEESQFNLRPRCRLCQLLV